MVRIGSDGKEINEVDIPEKELQAHVENHSEKLLNCYLIKSKFNFEGRYGKTGGELDSLMIDKESLRPVIVEYKIGKLDRNKTAVNQIVYYYDWIKDHKSKVNNLILEEISQKKLNFEVISENEDNFTINWNEGIRCIIIAQEFSDWDEVLLEYININIELYKYHKFENGTFELNPARDLQNKIRVQKKTNQDLAKERKEIQTNDEGLKKFYEISKFNSIKIFIDNWLKKIEIRVTQYYIAFINPVDKTTLIRLYIRKTMKLKITLIPIISLDELKERFPNLIIKEDPYAHDLPITITELTSEEDVSNFLNFISKGLENYL